MTKTLIMIRHGHRDTTRRELNNGLSEKGREQAKSVRRFFNDRFEHLTQAGGLWLVASPKVRCVETLEPLARQLERDVDAHPELHEQGAREPRAAFEERIHSFIHEWTHASVETTILCSHGDWLPVAAYHLLGIAHEFKKGSWLELEWNGERAALKWYVPSFKTFYRT